MNLRVFVAGLAIVGLALWTGSLVAVEDEPPAGEMEQAMAEYMKYATPGEHHEHLARLEGSWDAAGKMWMDPEAEPQEFGGVSENTMVLGGRFLQLKYAGTAMGQPFQGLGLSGYDNYRQKHVDVWMDTMGTMIAAGEGQCEDGGKVLDMTSRWDDPVSGSTKMNHSVLRIVSDDQHVLEMYELTPEGDERKVMEITYNRQ